jgi:hypothetical protein
VYIVGGVIGAFFFSFILDKYRCYLKSLKIVCFGCFVSMCGVYFTMPLGNFNIYAINTGVLGFFVISIIPIGYSFSVELTYPVSEVMSNGLILVLSKLLGAILTIYGTDLTQKQPHLVIIIFAI